MSKRGKRKTFGMKKKQAHNLHHLKKKKKEPAYKLSSTASEIKHLHVSYL